MDISLGPGILCVLTILGGIANGIANECGWQTCWESHAKAIAKFFADEKSDRYGDPLPAGAVARLGTRRLCHATEYGRIYFSRDGRRLITCDLLAPTTVSVWDPSSGALIRRFAAPFDHFALSPDGRWLAAASSPLRGDTKSAPSLAVIDLTRDPRTRKFDLAGSHQPFDLSFSNDGKVLVTTGYDSVALWDVASGRLMCLIEVRSVNRAQLSSRGTRYYTASFTGIQYRALHDRRVEWEAAPRESRRFGDVAIAVDDSVIAVVEGDKEAMFGDMVRLFDGQTGKERRPVRGSEGVSDLAMSGDGRLLATADRMSGIITIWDLGTGRRVQRLATSWPMSPAMAFSGDGRLFAYSEGKGFVVRETTNWTEPTPLPRHFDAVRTFAFTSDGGSLLACDAKSRCILWNARNGQAIAQYEIEEPEIRDVAVSPDGTWFVAAGSCAEVDLRKTANGRRLRSLEAFDGAAERGESAVGVAISPDGKLVATRITPGVVRVFDVATGKMTAEIANISSLYGKLLAFTPDGRSIACAIGGGRIGLFETSSGKEIEVLWDINLLDDVAPNVTSVAIAPNGEFLAAGFADGTLRIWRLSTGRIVLAIHAADEALSTLAFSADSRRLAAGDAGATASVLRVWELASGKRICERTVHDSTINALAFSPDGRMLASAHNDGTILFWDAAHQPRRWLEKKTAETWATPQTQWESLGNDNPAIAHAVVDDLSRDPNGAARLGAWLRPVAPPPREEIRRLIADIDSPDFKTRDKAHSELCRFRELAAPALREAMANSTTLERTRRVQTLLDDIESRPPSSDRVRAIRALSALEYSVRPEARALLAELSRGEPAAWLTNEARAALERIERQQRVPRQDWSAPSPPSRKCGLRRWKYLGGADAAALAGA